MTSPVPIVLFATDPSADASVDLVSNLASRLRSDLTCPQTWNECVQAVTERRATRLLVLVAEDVDDIWPARLSSLCPEAHGVSILTVVRSPDVQSRLAWCGLGSRQVISYHEAADVIERTAFQLQADVSKEMHGEALATPDEPGWPMIGRSLGLQRAFQQIAHAAEQDALEVQVTGESGTGKHLAATTIHEASPRRDGPFVVINCAVVPDRLLEVQLFGREGDDGSVSLPGDERCAFERAAGGTLVLDEMAEIGPALQARLLQFVQNRTYHRVGEHDPLVSDARLVTVTHRRLETRAARGEFRSDLLYRLRAVHVDLPPLRERDDDVVMLAHRLAASFNRALQRNVTSFHPDAVQMLRSHPWPGNVRELINVMKHAMLAAHGELLLPEFLPPLYVAPTNESTVAPSTARPVERRSGMERRGQVTGSPLDASEAEVVVRPRSELNDPGRDDLSRCMEVILRRHPKAAYAEALKAVDHRLVKLALMKHNGNISATARHLGITRVTLRRKLREAEDGSSGSESPSIQDV